MKKCIISETEHKLLHIIYYKSTVTKSAKSEMQKITSELRSNARRMFRQLVSSEVGGRLDWVSGS